MSWDACLRQDGYQVRSPTTLNPLCHKEVQGNHVERLCGVEGHGRRREEGGKSPVSPQPPQGVHRPSYEDAILDGQRSAGSGSPLPRRRPRGCNCVNALQGEPPRSPSSRHQTVRDDPSPLFRATMSWVICYRYEANDTKREGRAGEDERGREGERRRVWPCQEGEKLRAVLEEKGCRNPGRRCVWLRKGPGSRSQTDVKREIKSLKRRK